MPTYAYLRVSTDKQDHDSQRNALVDCGVDQWFTDTASGARTDRPALLEMLDVVKRGDVVLVYRLDRLGRSMVHLVTTVLGLADRGVTVRSISEQLDTSTPMGRMILAMYAGMAELERENIRERVTAGLAARKARGLPVGSSKAVLRARGQRGAEVRVEERQRFAESIRWVLEPLSAEGLSMRAMAAKLNERQVATLTGSGSWTHKSVGNALARLEVTA